MSKGGQDFFRDATVRLCSSLDIEKAMFRCLSYLHHHIPAREMLLTIFDPNTHLIHNIATVDLEGVKQPFPSKPLSEEAINRINRDAGAWSEIKILERAELHPAALTLASSIDPSKTSIMYMSLVIEGKFLGSVVFLADGKGVFRDEHAALVSQLREPFNIAVSNALRYREVMRLKDMVDAENRNLTRELRYTTEDEIVGADGGLREVMEMVRKVASLNSPVLLLGETGVGKEVVANAIHYASPRKDKPFVTVNCGAIPESLMDSELFGHERGAFTGAIAQKKGRFERADRGSIFLDEVAELPPSAQVRLLRVLQNRQIERVGGAETISVDIRIIAATHRNLEEMVRSGRFREDLWFRLNIFPVMIPPLRHRRDDIPGLLDHFIQEKSRELKIHTPPPLSPDVMERLMSYHWPGNVRELENLVERELIRSRTPNGNHALTFEPFGWPKHPQDTWRPTEGRNTILTLNEAMSRHIQEALSMTKGKIYGPDGAARRLKVNPNTLRSRMKKLGIVKKSRESADDKPWETFQSHNLTI
ncbi:MAG TPA: sigma 54-interacting transcriptional regulator [Syntrophales bacterium]|nr:sigma 54-interacting transcriptional regulator [Syntrophales bacterium]